MPNMWSVENTAMEDEARRARLLAIFNSLSSNDQELVMRVSEVIQEAKLEKMNKHIQDDEKTKFENE
jgi:hypothetical protein